MKYRENAKRRWPQAEWIIGNGSCACVLSRHPGPVVLLFETMLEGEIARKCFLELNGNAVVSSLTEKAGDGLEICI